MIIQVHNISRFANHEALHRLFVQYGTVENLQLSWSRVPGSKGFGILAMPNKNEAELAIARLNGHRIDNIPLQVTEAKQEDFRNYGMLCYFKRYGS